MENLSQKKTTKLLPVVEEGWDEPVDRIESARFEDDGSIIAIAYSGDLPLAVKIDDEEIDVRPIEGDVIEDEDNTQFSEQPDRSLDDAAAQFSKIPEGTVKHVNGRDYFMHDDAEIEGGCTAGRLDSEFDFTAPKKKNCIKGISCGGTCISANKICSRELDPEAKAMVAALRKRIKAGDKDAAAGLDKFRQARSNPKSNLDRLLEDLDKIDLDSQFGLLDAGSVMREIRTDLIKTGMPFERASELVDRIKMPELSASFNEADLAKVRESAIEVFQLTNGVGSEKLKEFINTDPRAWASSRRGQINVGHSTQNEIFHEIGHFAEKELAGSVEKNTAWVKSRASGEPQELAILTGSETYDKTELAYPDKFYTPYVGKIYPNATEVISMGLEKFGYGWEMAIFYKQDPEHFKLIINFLKETRNVRN